MGSLLWLEPYNLLGFLNSHDLLQALQSKLPSPCLHLKNLYWVCSSYLLNAVPLKNTTTKNRPPNTTFYGSKIHIPERVLRQKGVEGQQWEGMNWGQKTGVDGSSAQREEALGFSSGSTASWCLLTSWTREAGSDGKSFLLQSSVSSELERPWQPLQQRLPPSPAPPPLPQVPLHSWELLIS